MGLFYLILNVLGLGLKVCIFHYITGFACPACGMTRGFLSLSRADFYSAIMIYNALSIPAFIIMLLIPIFLLYDYVYSKHTLYNFYVKLEDILKRPIYYIPLSLLIVSNWIWNILKDL